MNEVGKVNQPAKSSKNSPITNPQSLPVAQVQICCSNLSSFSVVSPVCLLSRTRKSGPWPAIPRRKAWSKIPRILAKSNQPDSMQNSIKTVLLSDHHKMLIQSAIEEKISPDQMLIHRVLERKDQTGGSHDEGNSTAHLGFPHGLLLLFPEHCELVLAHLLGLLRPLLRVVALDSRNSTTLRCTRPFD